MATESAPNSLQQAILFFADYENCHKAIIAIRWPDGVVSLPARCGSEQRDLPGERPPLEVLRESTPRRSSR